MNGQFLIIHPGGIGDVLLALPAIRSLHRRYGVKAGALVANRQVGELLRSCGEASKLFSLESRALSDFLGTATPGRSTFHAWVRGCEVAVGWMSDHDGRLASILSDYGVGQVIIQSPFSEGLSSRHQSDRIVETLKRLGLEGSMDQPLNLPPTVIQAGQASLKAAGISSNQRPIIIHPGSGSIHKCCDPWLWVHLISWLQEHQLTPVLIEGPADEAAVCRLQGILSRTVPVLKHAELCEIAGVLHASSMYVGHDSGATHLAAAVGVPTVAVFGPTDDERWAPRGKNVTVLRGGLCHCKTWEAVQRCGDKPCLAIAIDSLINGCARILG